MDEQPAKNTFETMPDGIMLLTQTGYQTEESVSMFQAKMDALTEEIHKQGKKSLILVDMSAVTGHTPKARAEGRERLAGNYDAMAVFGTSQTLSMIVNWLIKATGSADKVQFFTDRELALSWLRSHLK